MDTYKEIVYRIPKELLKADEKYRQNTAWRERTWLLYFQPNQMQQWLMTKFLHKQNSRSKHRWAFVGTVYS